MYRRITIWYYIELLSNTLKPLSKIRIASSYILYYFDQQIAVAIWVVFKAGQISPFVISAILFDFFLYSLQHCLSFLRLYSFLWRLCCFLFSLFQIHLIPEVLQICASEPGDVRLW